MPLRIEGTDSFGRSWTQHDNPPPQPDRALALANGAHGAYRHAGRGIGQYALAREPAWVSRNNPPNALRRFGNHAAVAGVLLAAGAFLFGFWDAVAAGDSPGLAQDRVFFHLQDILVTGPHMVALKVFGSSGLLDAVLSAAGFCVAVLTAECAGLGAMAAHLIHLGGL
jgi:hypothetical protein